MAQSNRVKYKNCYVTHVETTSFSKFAEIIESYTNDKKCNVVDVVVYPVDKGSENIYRALIYYYMEK